MLFMSLVVLSEVAVLWMFWGWSLTYGSGSPYIGDLKQFGLINTLATPHEAAPRIPSIVFCVYQFTFAAVTPAIAFGASAERGRLGPLMILVAIWSTIVYSPIAHWVGPF